MLHKAKKFLKSIQLKNKQRNINKKYQKEGLTEEVIDAQVELNTLRNELDIPDSKNFVWDKYVQ